MRLMPDDLAREQQGLPPRYTPLKTVTWKEDEEIPNNYEPPRYNKDSEPVPNVDETGSWHNL